MYYKIENKKCKVYKKLHALRTKEYKMRDENEEAIKNKIKLKWDNYLGYPEQDGFNRLKDFQGFEFKETAKVDLSVWKLHSKHGSIYIPNRRTKDGKEMKKFLSSLKQSMCFNVFDILGIEVFGRFKIPYMEIYGETIVLFLGEGHKSKDKNIIEITSVEFDKIRKSKTVTP